MAALYEIQADGALGSCWAIDSNSTVIGRGELAEVQIDDNSLSRSHFLIAREGAEYFLIDLDSQNGTWLDGRKIKGSKLSTGDIIRAGETLLYFTLTPVSAALDPLVIPEMMRPEGLRVAKRG